MDGPILRPPRLRPGDTVAVLSLSWGGAQLFPRVFELGLENLRRLLGVRIVEFPTTRATPEFLLANPRARADDLNDAFADPSIHAIISSIGGDDSVRILPYVDVAAAVRTPKILMGFSDTTTVLTLLNQHGLVTFNGPAVLAGFSSLHHLPDAADHVRRMLCEPVAPFEYRPYGAHTERTQSWSDPNYEGRLELVTHGSGFTWLQGTGTRRGRMFGGCIEVLEFMKGTRFWPLSEFWSGRVLFLETSEDKPTPTQVGYMLRNYGVQGVFDRIGALLFARPYTYSDEERTELRHVILRVVRDEFGCADLPVVTDMEFGHEEPQLVMPNGGLVEIDCEARAVRLVESPVV